MYDLVIVGTGPAGLTASIYASCFHLKHIVIGKVLGGQLQLAPDILNYSGFEDVTGKELTERMVGQVKKRGGELVEDSVVGVESGFKVKTESGEEYRARAVILATGTERRKLNVAGEIEYTGKGIHYCATCDKQDYAGQVCAVVGGANSAVQAAVQVAEVAKKVYLIYRGTELRGDPVWLDRVKEHSNIEVLYGAVVSEVVGDGSRLTGVKLNDKSLVLDKLFIEIGGVPGTALVIPLGVNMDPGGYIKVNSKLETNVAGIFAAGDMVSYGLSIEQIASAVGLGARAAASAFAYLKDEKSAPTVWGKAKIRR